MSIYQEGDSRRSAPKLNNIFWKDLRGYLTKVREEIRAAPVVANTLSESQRTRLKTAFRVYLLVGQGIDPLEARRLAFEEFYPPNNDK